MQFGQGANEALFLGNKTVDVGVGSRKILKNVICDNSMSIHLELR